MLNIITYNPYRILGVYINSPKKDIVANKSRIQAFARVNREISFPQDLDTILPKLSRAEEAISKAESSLTLLKDQIYNAQFWFIKSSSVDEIAFGYLFRGEIFEAGNIWKKVNKFSSCQNLFICSLLVGDYVTAINEYASKLYEEYFQQFIELFDNSSSISKQTLISNIVNELVKNGSVTPEFINKIENPVWKKVFGKSTVSPLIKEINDIINNSEAKRAKGANEALASGQYLQKKSKQLLSQLNKYLSKTTTEWQILCDKLSNEILQCSIDYYNDSDDIDSACNAYPLCEYAQSIAVGQVTKDRCSKNADIIKKAYKTMPSREYIEYEKEVRNIFNNYRGSESGLGIFKQTHDVLRRIREQFGKKDKYYVETSSKIANMALHDIIEEVNRANDALERRDNTLLFSKFYIPSKYDLQRLSKAYRAAWQTMLYIDLMEMTDDFKKNRYEPNRKTLHSNISHNDGFMCPNSSNVMAGCGWGLSAPNYYFLSDTELYKSAWSIKKYEIYLKEFPSGKYVPEAKEKLKRLKQIRVCLIILGIVALFIFAHYLYTDLNTPSYSSGSRLPTNTEFVDTDSVATDEYANSDTYVSGEVTGSVSEDQESTSSYDDNDISTEINEYENNSLRTWSRPYSDQYGGEYNFDENEDRSRIKVTAPSDVDAILIVKIAKTGEVADHIYIRKGQTAYVDLPNGRYQPFFYTGKGWNPTKKMPKGLTGGFVEYENIQKDSPTYLENEILTYSLTSTVNGNFQAKSSNKNEAF